MQVIETDDREHRRLARASRLLSDPTRLKLLSLLGSHNGLAVKEITRHFDLEQPTISHHLRLLRNGGIVDYAAQRGHGLYHYYFVREDKLRSLLADLQSYLNLGKL